MKLERYAEMLKLVRELESLIVEVLNGEQDALSEEELPEEVVQGELYSLTTDIQKLLKGEELSPERKDQLSTMTGGGFEDLYPDLPWSKIYGGREFRVKDIEEEEEQ